MTFSQALHAFFVDAKFQTAIGVIFLDFALGTLAALKLKTFKLSYVSAFAKNDLAFKLVPWMFIYLASKVAGHQKIAIPGLDLGVAAGAMYAALLVAWTGSILSSLKDLGFTIPGGATLQQAVAGSENAPPPPVVSPTPAAVPPAPPA